MNERYKNLLWQSHPGTFLTHTHDGPQIDALVAKVRKKDYGFRSLIHEIVAGKLFRSK